MMAEDPVQFYDYYIPRNLTYEYKILCGCFCLCEQIVLIFIKSNSNLLDALDTVSEIRYSNFGRLTIFFEVFLIFFSIVAVTWPSVIIY